MGRILEGPYRDEKEYWDEEAERINALAETARRNGVTVPTPEPPALNPDGSLVTEPETEEE